MTDNLVQRIRAEADMASRAGQSAALHKIADDLAARGDAATLTVTAELKTLHQPEETTVSVPVFDEFDSPYQVVTRCRECRRPWPCRTASALGIEVEGGEHRA